MKIKGIGASNGISIAKVFKFVETNVKISDVKIDNIEAEIKKVDDAIKLSIKEIKDIKGKAVENLPQEEAAVFDAHIQVASDPSMLVEINDLIKNNNDNALKATSVVTTKYVNMFAAMEDTYMKERAADIRDVAKRIMRNLVGIKSQSLSNIDHEVILVADDLSPSETAVLDKKYVKGFLTNIGGRTSHAAIMARSLEIPAVLGLKDITEKVKVDDIVAIDGETGIVLINPTESQISAIKQKAQKLKEEELENLKFKDKQTVSADGHVYEIASNIGSPKDIGNVTKHGSEGVGLFRSEFLYMDAVDWPSEEEQYQAYKKVLKGLDGQRVVVRTLDIGGDKTLKYYKFPEEMNPFLGYRAIRLSLDKIDIFKTQLRALLRSSIHGKLAIMFPMIATINEFKRAKKILKETKMELISENIEVSESIEVGMMVEIPAAAVIADQFAKYADFLSLGTNDLMQYSMAADRMSEKVSYLYQPLNPAILRLINMTIEGGHKHNKWVGMCGEIAGDMRAIPLLVGMGLDEFSMSATSVLAARRVISKIKTSDAKLLAHKAMELNTQEEVRELVDKFIKTKINN